MDTVPDSFRPEVGGGDGSTDTRDITPPEDGNAQDTEGDEFEHTEIFDIHQRFLRTFGSLPLHKLEQGVDTKVVQNCLKQSYKGGSRATKKVDINILGIPSYGDYTGFQTILHQIPTALRASWDTAGEDPRRNARTESFVCLFRWLMETFPLLYSLKGDDSDSDFLQLVIDNATSGYSSAQGRKSKDASVIARNRAEAAREVLKVFACEFPKQAAELLQVGPVPQDRERAHRVHNLLSLVEGFGEIVPLFKAFDANTILATDDNGDTVLHRATEYGTSPGQSAGGALKIVKDLVYTCPEALKVLNYKGLSPYQTRAKKLVKRGDEVARFLKAQYIRYPAEEATYLLYGVEGGPELCLNLENLRGQRVPEKQLVSLLQRLNLDTHLIFVRLPRFSVIPDEGSLWDEQERLGSGRDDFAIIFRVLREDIGVEKIFQLEVEDIDQPSHSDDIIIGHLRGFGIEVWDWRKLDLCTDVIREAAENVRHIRLYSSGNNAVLRGWSCEDGLQSFVKLESVHVTFIEGLVPENTVRKYGRNFVDRIYKACGRGSPKKFGVRLDFPEWDSSATNSRGTFTGGRGYDRVAGNRWIRDIRRISRFVHSVFPKDPTKREVKVAIIHDGICLYNFEPGSMAKDIHGRSFESDLRETHGISHLAINWAVGQDVDIISMSWTIESPRDAEDEELRRAIYEAHCKEILLFGTTYNENTYPANNPYITCIGGANIYGDQIPKSRKGNTSFTFPSSDLGLEFQEDADVEGSSISTALAAGLAALIIYCAEYTGLCESRGALRMEVTRMFQAMTAGYTDPVFVDPKLFFDLNDPNNRHAEAEGFELIRRAIENLKKKAKLLMAPLISLLRHV